VWGGAGVLIGNGVIRLLIGLTRDQARTVMADSGESAGGVRRCKGEGVKERM